MTVHVKEIVKIIDFEQRKINNTIDVLGICTFTCVGKNADEVYKILHLEHVLLKGRLNIVINTHSTTIHKKLPE